MENITKKNIGNRTVYTAADGYVITTYQEGDTSIVYSKTYTVRKGTTPRGIYAMLLTEAEAIAESLKPEEEDTDIEANANED